MIITPCMKLTIPQTVELLASCISYVMVVSTISKHYLKQFKEQAISKASLFPSVMLCYMNDTFILCTTYIWHGTVQLLGWMIASETDTRNMLSSWMRRRRMWSCSHPSTDLNHYPILLLPSGNNNTSVFFSFSLSIFLVSHERTSLMQSFNRVIELFHVICM